MRTLGALTLALVACSAGPRGGGAGAPSSATASAACAPITDEELRPRPRGISAETFTLGELFPHEQPVPTGPVLKMNLGSVRYGVSPAPPSGGVRLGPPPARFEPGWLVGGVRPALTPAYDAWAGALARTAAAGWRSRRLVRRLWTLAWEADQPGARSTLVAERLCATDARLAADAEGAGGARDELRARTELLDALEAGADLGFNERFLLAHLLFLGAGEASPERAVAVERADALYRDIAGDAGAPLALRMLAERERATTTRAGRPDAERASHFARIAATSDDPALQLEAGLAYALLLPASGVGADGATRRSALESLHDAYRNADATALRADLGRVLAALGEVRFDAGDEVGALSAWAECLETARLDEENDDDPWRCATSLATGLRAYGGARGDAAKLAVSVTYAASVGVAVMRNAIEARDRVEATRAGELALDRAPDARDAPIALALLLELTTDPARRRALTDERSTRYGAGSTWFTRESLRLAGNGALASAIQMLLTPWDAPAPPAPTTDDEWRVEVRDDRAPKLSAACGSALSEEMATITARIDTTGSTPRVTATSAKPIPASTACLEREVGVYFRSVPPAELTLVLAP